MRWAGGCGGIGGEFVPMPVLDVMTTSRCMVRASTCCMAACQSLNSEMWQRGATAYIKV